MVKPISPDDVVKIKKQNMPDEVIETFNELIAKEWNGRYALLFAGKVASAIAKKLHVKVDKVYDNHWLDVEDIFRAEGWKVVFEKPDYNESGDSTFTFSKKA